MNNLFLACDLGASNGRMLRGRLNSGNFEFEEIHRFDTPSANLVGVCHWDIMAIFRELTLGLHKVADLDGPSAVQSIAIDSWGVDYALMGSDGSMLGNPIHYRDRRTETMPELAHRIIPKRDLYAMTGIGFNRFNTLYQLLAAVHAGSPALKAADSMLMIGDLFHYLLSGTMSCEYTNASTTQLMNADSGEWHDEITRRMKIPRKILREIVPAGTTIGTLLPSLAEETGLSADIVILTPATHDTASAIAATPVDPEAGAWSYISCGTWSIMGTELDRPFITDESYVLEFSNEGGALGKTCFQKTFIGLWLIQECRRIWQRDQASLGYEQLMQEAAAAEPFLAVINVDDPRLYAPDDMPATIRTICHETGQVIPPTRGELTRCVVESIALKYRRTLREIDGLLRRKTQRIHMMGGGVKNELLCRLTADACGVTLLAGPIEAAILGNFAMQALATGAFGTLAEARRAVLNSSEIRRYEPGDQQAWDELERILNGESEMTYADA